MSTTQPIRDKNQLEQFKDYYKNEKPNPRNHTLILVSLNTALRISDLLSLTYDMVYDGEKVRTHVELTEQKTGKGNLLCLNKHARRALEAYRKKLVETETFKSGNRYLFPSPRKEGGHLSRFQAYRIIRAAADAVGIEGPIGCHSMRKTFGYHAWKKGCDPLVLMVLFNHSSIDITRRYLCLDQDDKDAVYLTVEL